jgi:hypothetical protein
MSGNGGEKIVYARKLWQWKLFRQKGMLTRLFAHWREHLIRGKMDVTVELF